MNWNVNLNLPDTLDILHLCLAGVIVLLIILNIVFVKRKPGAKTKPEEPAGGAGEAAPAAEAKPAEGGMQAAELKALPEEAALQVLALFQQEARLIDFLKEELTGFSDADVGAAARVVHEGGQKVLDDYFQLEPIRGEDEESRITVEAGFDPQTIRLTGNVVGEAPFTGTLIHKGWQAKEVTLPKLTAGHNARILAPAEVEL